MADHPRIWLQNEADADKYNGRLWCEDKVWPDEPDDSEPTGYVRVDLFEDILTELQRVTDHLEEWARYHSDERTAETDAAIYCARAAITKAAQS